MPLNNYSVPSYYKIFLHTSFVSSYPFFVVRYSHLHFILFTYLLTPWSRVLFEKLTGSQLVKKFPAFYGTRRFITAFTSARNLFLSSARSIQSMPPPSHFLNIHLNIIHPSTLGSSNTLSHTYNNFPWFPSSLTFTKSVTST